MTDFRGSKLWDFRANPARGMCFHYSATDDARDDVRKRALIALRHAINGEAGDLEGPLWALTDLSGGSDRVRDACDWFRVAAAYAEGDELRKAKCGEAYMMIERAFRTYL